MATAMKQFAGKQPALSAGAIAAATTESIRAMQAENDRLRQIIDEMDKKKTAPRARRTATKRRLERGYFWRSNETNPVMREAAHTLKRRGLLLDRAQAAYDAVLEVFDGEYPAPDEPRSDKQTAALVKYFHAVAALNFNAEMANLLGRYNHHMDSEAIVECMMEANNDFCDGPPEHGFSPAIAENLPEDAGMTLSVKRRLITNAAGDRAVLHEATFASASFYSPDAEKVVLPYAARQNKNITNELAVSAPSMDAMIDGVEDKRFRLVDPPVAGDDEEYSSDAESKSDSAETREPSPVPLPLDEDELDIAFDTLKNRDE